MMLPSAAFYMFLCSFTQALDDTTHFCETWIMQGYHCRSCGKVHDALPLTFGPDAPAYWYGLSESDRRERADLSSDRCVIDGEHFFIRGRLELPIVGSDQCFSWLVWTTLSRDDFLRTTDLWSQQGRETEPPYFGWLSTELKTVYGVSTINLKTHVHTRPIGRRPCVEVEPTDHPLAIEQQKGISWDRVQAFAEHLLHG